MSRPQARPTLLLPFLLLACSSGEKPDAPQTVVQLRPPSIDTSTPALDSLPAPTPPQDTIIRLYYRDVTLALYRVTESRADILLQVILTRAGRRLPFGIDVGTRREDVVAIQAPTREGRDDEGLETLEYHGPMERPGVVRFVLRRDRVQRIEWVYFID